MKRILAAILVLGALTWFIFFRQPTAHWTGTVVDASPKQVALNLPRSWNNGKYTFIPRAHYQLKAVVLSKHHYWAGYDEDYLSPYDLALGWGPMSDSQVINKLDMWQYGRFYHYTWKGAPPLDPISINRNSSNTHIIAANNEILQQIKKVRRFDVVDLKGYLVDIKSENGWHWDTSLTRDDSAGGACEILYVTEMGPTISLE